MLDDATALVTRLMRERDEARAEIERLRDERDGVVGELTPLATALRRAAKAAGEEREEHGE